MHYKQCLVVFDYIYAVQFDWIVEMLCCFTPFCFTSSHFLRLKAHSCVFYKVKSFMNINISYVNETFSLWTTRKYNNSPKLSSIDMIDKKSKKIFVLVIIYCIHILFLRIIIR